MSSLSGSWWDSNCGRLKNSASLASESTEARSKELSLPASLLESVISCIYESQSLSLHGKVTHSYHLLPFLSSRSLKNNINFIKRPDIINRARGSAGGAVEAERRVSVITWKSDLFWFVIPIRSNLKLAVSRFRKSSASHFKTVAGVETIACDEQQWSLARRLHKGTRPILTQAAREKQVVFSRRISGNIPSYESLID